MRKVTHLFLALAMVCGMAACAGSGGISTNPGDMIGDWQLQSVDGGQSGGQEFTLSFNRDGTVAGVAGCNMYAGEYTASEGEEDTGSVNIESFSATRIECPEAQNPEFLELIESVNAFQVRDNNEMTLRTGQQELVLRRVESDGEQTSG